jgi:Cd2+/Zn2+-exporting ATPase
MERSEVSAVRIDPDRRTIALATLGEIDAGELREQLETALKAASDSLRTSVRSDGPRDSLTVTEEDGQTMIAKPGCLTESAFWRWSEFDWPEEEARESHEHEEEDWRLLMGEALVCGLAGVAGWVVESVAEGSVAFARVLYIIALIAGGSDAALEVLEKLRHRRVDIHFLMLAVAAGAVVIGAWTEGVLLLFLFSFSSALEHFALHRTRKEVDALFKSAPKEAKLVLADGSHRAVPVESVVPGDTLRIKPGELFPVDSVILSGRSAADESNLTGEATPVEKTRGDPVYSGTLNLWGAVQARAARPEGESSLHRILRLIKEAQQQKAPSQRFTDRFGTRYTVGILCLTATMFFYWWLAPLSRG